MSRKQKLVIVDWAFIVYCLLFIVSPIFFFRLGSTTLTNWDEAWFASVAADMAQRRDFVVGHWNGQVWFYEPPMLTTALSWIITIFGKSEFWLRSFNAVCGFLIVLLTAFLGWKFSGIKIGGLFSALILLSDIEFLFRSRQINVEIPVTLFLPASLASAFMAAKTKKTRRFVLTGFFLGLSFLTKRASPLLAVPAIIYALTRNSHSDVIARSLRPARNASHSEAGGRGNLTLKTRLPRFLRSLAMTMKKSLMRKLLIFFFSIFVTVFPWFSYQYWRFGRQFIDEFFIGYTLGKIRAVNPGAGMSPLFYLSALKHAFKIWFFVIPVAIAWVIWVARKKQEYRVFLLYAATFFFALTAASIKSSWFLLPVHPILAIFVGVFLVRICHSGGSGATDPPAGAWSVPPAKKWYWRAGGDWRAGRIRRFSIVFGSLVVSASQLFFYRHQFIVPDTTSHQVTLVERARSITTSDDPLYLDDEYLPVAVFYSDRRVIPLRFNRGQPIINLDVPVGSTVLSNQETIDRFREHIGLPLETIGEERDLLLLRVGSGKNQESEEEESGKGEV